MKRIVLLISLYTLAYNTGCTAKKKMETEEAGKYTVTSPLKG